MKKLVYLLLFMPFVSFGQENLNYAVVKDAPFNPKLNLNLELASIEGSFKNGNRLSVSVGAWGSYRVNDKIKTDFSISRSLINNHYTYIKTPAYFDMNLGGNYRISSSTKLKKATVNYSRESKGKEFGKETFRHNFKNYERTVEIETFEVKYFEMMSNVQTDLGIRGGLNVRSRSFYDDDIFDELAAHRSVGLYAGLSLTSIRNLIVDVENHGRYSVSSQSEWYFDAILIGSNKFKDYETGNDVTDKAKSIVSAGSPIGFRLGYTSTEIEKRELTGKKFGLAIKCEGGIMPYEGLFLKAGFAICILKR